MSPVYSATQFNPRKQSPCRTVQPQESTTTIYPEADKHIWHLHSLSLSLLRYVCFILLTQSSFILSQYNWSRVEDCVNNNHIQFLPSFSYFLSLQLNNLLLVKFFKMPLINVLYLWCPVNLIIRCKIVRWSVNQKGCGNEWSWPYTDLLFWHHRSDWRESWKTSARMVLQVQPETWIRHFLNTT